MLSDPQRGGVWTEAILGVCASRIHVCASENAKPALIRLIRLCQDSYEIVSHQRMTPLLFDPNTADRCKKGDALIVFSRRSVYSTAQLMKNRGHSVSILYGAMPYDVKQSEARQFREGKTDLLIATDCIGMGMNLPIQRIRFLEEEKFDGVRVRPLEPAEVQQIAGRAGRFGVYPEGYFSGSAFIQVAFSENPEPVTIHIKYPRNIWQLEGKLSEILSYWDSQIRYKGFVKQDCSELIDKVSFLEKHYHIKNNALLMKLASVPFDLNSGMAFSYWGFCVSLELDGEMPRMPFVKPYTLEDLELSHKLLDIYCHFAADDEDLLEEGLAEKQSVSQQISLEIEKLVRKKAKKRKKKKKQKKHTEEYPSGSDTALSSPETAIEKHPEPDGSKSD